MEDKAQTQKNNTSLNPENGIVAKDDISLLDSEIKYRALFENMSLAASLNELIYQDGKVVDYRVLDINPAYEQLTGICREKAIGSLASQLYDNLNASYLKVYSKVAQTGKPSFFETYIKNFKKYFFITVSKPHPGIIFIITRDITKLKKAEQKLKRLKDSLQKQVDKQTQELQERVKLLERFNQAAIEREFRIKELKEEIKRLKAEK